MAWFHEVEEYDDLIQHCLRLPAGTQLVISVRFQGNNIITYADALLPSGGSLLFRNTDNPPGANPPDDVVIDNIRNEFLTFEGTVSVYEGRVRRETQL